MMRPIEAMARALARELAHPPEFAITKTEADREACWPYFEDEARAALAAIRTPDLAQTMAFHNAVGRPIGVTAETVWMAMIDAALGS